MTPAIRQKYDHVVEFRRAVGGDGGALDRETSRMLLGSNSDPAARKALVLRILQRTALRPGRSWQKSKKKRRSVGVVNLDPRLHVRLDSGGGTQISTRGKAGVSNVAFVCDEATHGAFARGMIPWRRVRDVRKDLSRICATLPTNSDTESDTESDDGGGIVGGGLGKAPVKLMLKWFRTWRATVECAWALLHGFSARSALRYCARVLNHSDTGDTARNHYVHPWVLQHRHILRAIGAKHRKTTRAVSMPYAQVDELLLRALVHGVVVSRDDVPGEHVAVRADGDVRVSAWGVRPLVDP